MLTVYCSSVPPMDTCFSTKELITTPGTDNLCDVTAVDISVSEGQRAAIKKTLDRTKKLKKLFVRK